MKISKIVIVGCLTVLLSRHTLNLMWLLFESGEAILLLIPHGNTRIVLDLYSAQFVEHRFYLSQALGTFLFLLLIRYLFHHQLLLSCLCFSSLGIFSSLGLVFSKDSFVATQTTLIWLTGLLQIWIIVRIRKVVTPINVYEGWSKCASSDWWLLVFSIPVSLLNIGGSFLLIKDQSIFNLPSSFSMFLLVGIYSFALRPFCEELIFRGQMFQHLITQLNNRNGLLIATIITSLIFSLYHISLIQVVPAFITSIALCLVFYRTRSIIVCTGFHGLVNINNFLIVGAINKLCFKVNTSPFWF